MYILVAILFFIAMYLIVPIFSLFIGHGHEMSDIIRRTIILENGGMSESGFQIATDVASLIFTSVTFIACLLYTASLFNLTRHIDQELSLQREEWRQQREKTVKELAASVEQYQKEVNELEKNKESFPDFEEISEECFENKPI